VEEIVHPLLDGLAAEGRPYAGCLYCGLMITDKGPRLIEVNCRFGDPETQALLPRLRSDLAEVLWACTDGSLGSMRLEWSDEACVSVVVAAEGYPGGYSTGAEIDLERASTVEGVIVFHAGTALDGRRLVSAGGRVLDVTALGPTLASARGRAYEAVKRVRMKGMHYRTDIARGV
jgi:phosphoribosylamine--glycine ligase